MYQDDLAYCYPSVKNVSDNSSFRRLDLHVYRPPISMRGTDCTSFLLLFFQVFLTLLKFHLSLYILSLLRINLPCIILNYQCISTEETRLILIFPKCCWNCLLCIFTQFCENRQQFLQKFESYLIISTINFNTFVCTQKIHSPRPNPTNIKLQKIFSFLNRTFYCLQRQHY